MNERIPAPQPLAGGAIALGALCAVALLGAFTTAYAQGKKESVLEVFEASTQVPPEVAEMERARKQTPAAPAKARPSVDELVELIARQPGGREKLERARKGGRPDQPPPRASMADRAAEWFAWLPPLISPAHAAGALSVTVTPKVNTKGAHAGLKGSSSSPDGSLVLTAYSYGSYVSNVTTDSSHIYGYPFTIDWDSNTSSRSERPFVLTVVSVPKDGYYIVNTRAASDPGVQLRRYVASSFRTQAPSYPIVQTFGSGVTADRPALLYLTKGNHNLYWVFSGRTIFYSASVDSYP